MSGIFTQTMSFFLKLENGEWGLENGDWGIGD